ncbi:MAG TPA: hypothetical protein VEF76_05225 [Patescibacteria group bacterium]|nr:hypothetical protein [Patescibacteria group bacterium]
MKKLAEIFKRVAAAIPGASDPETLEEAQESVAKDTGYRDTLKRWAYTVGGGAATIGLLAIVAKSGPIIVAALAMTAAWGALRGGIALLNRDIRLNRAAEIAFSHAGAEGEDPAPALKTAPNLGTHFAAQAPANSNRIADLEKEVAALELQAAQQKKARELGLR